MAEPKLIFLHNGVYHRCTAHVNKHFDDYYCLQFMSHGKVELRYDQQRHLMEGSHYWLAYPGPRIAFQAVDGKTIWTHRYLAFRGPLLRKWKREGLLPYEPQPILDGQDHATRFDLLRHHARRLDRWGLKRATNILEGLLLELADERVRQTDRPRWLEHVYTHMEDSQGRECDYRRLARNLNMGLSTLRRRFKQTTGTSLHEHYLQRRVTEARRLLGESSLPTKAIAQQLEYSDVYYFSRQFRQHVGTSPAAYRKSRQG